MHSILKGSGAVAKKLAAAAMAELKIFLSSLYFCALLLCVSSSETEPI